MLAISYSAFMLKVQKLTEQDDLDAFLRTKKTGEYSLALAYLKNARGASTDLGPRKERLEALKKSLLAK